MALWSRDGEVQVVDAQSDRTQSGTIGGTHVVAGGISSKKFVSIIDDDDSSITYASVVQEGGPSSVTLVTTREQTFDTNGTTTYMNQVGAGFVSHFSGTSLGVLGRINAQSSGIRVYIDGKLTAARVHNWVRLNTAVYSILNPLSATANSIFVLANPNSSIGIVLIDNELISYTGYDAVQHILTGCTRGVQGTAAVSHTYAAEVYQWDTTVTVGYSSGQDFDTAALVWYNPFLSPGAHSVTVAVVAVNGYTTGFWFDGLVVGPLIGSATVYRTVASVTATVTTDPSTGVGLLGTLTTRSGVAIVGLLGFDLQAGSSLSTSPGVVAAQLHCSSVQTATVPTPYYYITGSVNTTYTVQMVFAYIGESL